MDRITLLVAIAITDGVVAIVKYSVAPSIIGSFGLIGVVGFIGGCFLIAHLLERKK